MPSRPLLPTMLLLGLPLPDTPYLKGALEVPAELPADALEQDEQDERSGGNCRQIRKEKRPAPNISGLGGWRWGRVELPVQTSD